MRILCGENGYFHRTFFKIMRFIYYGFASGYDHRFMSIEPLIRFIRTNIEPFRQSKNQIALKLVCRLVSAYNTRIHQNDIRMYNDEIHIMVQ